MAADEFAAEENSKQARFKWSLQLQVFGYMTEKHVLKLISSQLELAVTLIHESVHVCVILYWNVAVNVYFLLHHDVA